MNSPSQRTPKTWPWHGGSAPELTRKRTSKPAPTSSNAFCKLPIPRIRDPHDLLPSVQVAPDSDARSVRRAPCLWRRALPDAPPVSSSLPPSPKKETRSTSVAYSPLAGGSTEPLFVYERRVRQDGEIQTATHITRDPAGKAIFADSARHTKSYTLLDLRAARRSTRPHRQDRGVRRQSPFRAHQRCRNA